MSAQPCGCDPEAHWVCERHRGSGVCETCGAVYDRVEGACVNTAVVGGTLDACGGRIVPKPEPEP